MIWCGLVLKSCNGIFGVEQVSSCRYSVANRHYFISYKAQLNCSRLKTLFFLESLLNRQLPLKIYSEKFWSLISAMLTSLNTHIFPFK